MNKKMYKVLIADDEVWVTALVRGSIDWTDMNLELAGEAENGDEAYEMILSPVSYTHLDVYKRQRLRFSMSGQSVISHSSRA